MTKIATTVIKSQRNISPIVLRRRFDPDFGSSSDLLIGSGGGWKGAAI
ncbi:hypothetical protein KKF05_04925 [Patescibacteria group bacterium]|nr:hypothetical protein [Patescibacteria group bacterium]